MLDPYEAWRLAFVARVCGFDVSIRRSTETVGSKRFFSANETSWTHCLQLAGYEENEKVRIMDITPREHVFIEFPPIHTKRYQQPVAFRMEPIDTFVRATRTARGQRISEFGTYAGVAAGADLRIAVPEGILKLRGYVQRTPSGFQFVDSVKAGVIPPPTESSAVAVEPSSVDGGNN
jgi:hypothetical protein